ncbi:hypothetical protein CEE36_09745 [candidate division TA06 bacterium B3_TA06]|uniref:TIGR00374 family protein n=1 Tax=candidate division TA06 bacterium B3_TA06 TaxID=2012487 RepID=A0A532UZ62_UNCT6|nr:MAG: hypothetical protein CEE36_09745 [candidate division TA06 bacterium B3_TA06]
MKKTDSPKILKKIIRWIIQILAIGAIGFFLVRTVVRNWHEVADFPWHFNPWLLIASFALLAGTLLFMIVLWRWLLIRLGARISLGSAFRIFSLSSLGRYLPGKVWQVAGMVYLGRKEGVRAEAGVWAAVLAQILAVLSGILLTFAALFVEQERMLAPLLARLGIRSISLWWLLLPIAVILGLLHPRIIERITNWILRLLKREPIRFELSYPGLLGFFLLYLVSWLLYGTAFYLFLASVNPLPLSDWVVVTGGFAAAYIVGLLAIFVPGGLGVREGLLALFLSSLVGSGVAVALSFGQRLWFTAAELTFVLISVIFVRRRNGSKKVSQTGKAGS